MTDPIFSGEPGFTFRRPTDPAKERREKTEAVVVATLVRWAKENGVTDWGDANRINEAFPTVPDEIVISAMCEIRKEVENAFLDDLANTIEGQLARRALGVAGDV